MGAEKPEPNAELPSTYFAPPERVTPDQLMAALGKLSNNPMLDAVMQTLGGWVCVVNSCRQILVVNDSLLKALGISDSAAALGLRPGEALECVHAHDHTGGCGTSRFCATCGAAVAMLAAQRTNLPQQLECQITSEKDGLRSDHEFVVSCSPFTLEGEALLLISMRDTSEEKRRVAMERAFLHDASGLLTALSISANAIEHVPSEMGADNLSLVRQATAMLVREVRIQRLLAQDNPQAYPLELATTSVRTVVEQVKDLMSSHPVGRGQKIVVEVPPEDLELQTDAGLLSRVLSNMVANGLEAGHAGDEVRITARATADTVELSVWNRQAIPDAVAMRVFQRFFTTKPGGGRGLGTYTIKLLGETLLRGDVSFTTSPTAGTTFRIRLPRVFPGSSAK